TSLGAKSPIIFSTAEGSLLMFLTPSNHHDSESLLPEPLDTICPVRSGLPWRRRSRVDLARRNFDCRGAGAGADHRAEKRAALVLRPVGAVDAVVDRPVDRLKGDFLRHPRGADPPRLLPHRSMVPTRVLPVVAAHVERVIDHDGP